MDIEFAPSFIKAYNNLPVRIQKQVDKKINLLQANPKHPSLRVKKMEGYENLWELRVTRSCRITFEICTEYYYLRKVGTHDILGTP